MHACSFRGSLRHPGLLGGRFVCRAKKTVLCTGLVETLKDKGARVHLCNGKPYKSAFGVEGQPGNYHPRVLVVVGAVVVVGGSTPTAKSLVHGEVVLKVGGSTTVTAKVVTTAWAEAKRVEAL